MSRVSIEGDSSIFSSAGFVGQQGTAINTFSDTSSGGRRTSTSGSFAGVTNTARSAGGAAVGSLGWSGAGSGELPMRTPDPPMEEPQLDWLMQDPPENKHDFLIGSVWDSDVTNYDASSRFDENVFNDNAVPTSYNSKWISQQYQEQGLDFLSGGQVGFGAIKGIETSGGESRNKGQVNNVTTPGSGGGAGNTGVTMGGDFASYGNSNVGDGQRRSSARYSGGGGGAFGAMDYID